MKSLNTILLLLTGVIYMSACEAKCREKSSSKFKRSLKLAISSDDINNRHEVGLRKIFRRKRDVEDEEEIERDKFTAEIKFLEKWNPAMTMKDGSAYRLFQGNVLDAVLEQLNADRRFLNSRVLDLKKTSDGILAKVGFHFRKSEHNPISHIRFIVSRGHLSNLKVDKHYFKILKTPAKFFNENDKIKSGETLSQQKQSNKEQKIPVESKQAKQTTVIQEALNEPLPTSSQTQPANKPSDQAQKTPPAEQPSQSQNEAASSNANQAPVQSQATSDQNQYQSPAAQAQIPQDKNAAQVANEQQAQAAGQAQSQNSFQSQDNVQAPQYPSSQAQTAALVQQNTNTQEQDVAAYQPATETNTQLTTANPSNNADTDQTQNKDEPTVDIQNQLNSKLQKSSVTAQGTSQLENQQSSSSDNDDDEENISIKMNQAWFPFLSNHDSLQYKMLAGNFEKGLKSVMEDDKNIKSIKVKDLLQADEGHTTVKFVLKFNGDKKASTEKLRKIVKAGDIAGISVDANFFKKEDKKRA